MQMSRSFLTMLLCTFMGCERQDPKISASGFVENFSSPTLSSDWKNTGGAYEIVGGALHVKGARNHPLWLRKRLPKNVTIEFDVTSLSPEGDIKVEVFGDGNSYAKEDSYTATSYVIIFGGWGNQLNVLARMNEHGTDRVEHRSASGGSGVSRQVVPGKSYHFVITRKDRLLRVTVDGEPLLEMNDPDPLYGKGHDHFGINNWQSHLIFDNILIKPI